MGSMLIIPHMGTVRAVPVKIDDIEIGSATDEVQVR